MKQLYNFILSVLLLCFTFSHTVFAQDLSQIDQSHYWTFTYKVVTTKGHRFSDDCQEFSHCLTKETCESERLKLSKKSTYNDFLDETMYYVICSECVEHGAPNPNSPETEVTTSTSQNQNSKTEEVMKGVAVIAGSISNGFDDTAEDRYNSSEEQTKREAQTNASIQNVSKTRTSQIHNNDWKQKKSDTNTSIQSVSKTAFITNTRKKDKDNGDDELEKLRAKRIALDNEVEIEKEKYK